MFYIKVDKTRKEEEGQYFVELTKNRDLEVVNCDRLGYWCDKAHLEQFRRELGKVFKIENYTAIKTYEDACEKVGHLPVGRIKVEYMNDHQYRNMISDIAYLKLATIAKALNDDSNFPTFHKDEKRFYPRFSIINNEDGNEIDIEHSGYYTHIDNCIPANLCVKSSEIADYFGSQFITIWYEFLIGKGANND